MTREDFKIVQKYYVTSSLVMIFYKDMIIQSVEIFKNYGTIEDAEDKKAKQILIDKAMKNGKLPKDFRVAPVKRKSTKKKRTEEEISKECENEIKKFMQTHAFITQQLL